MAQSKEEILEKKRTYEKIRYQRKKEEIKKRLREKYNTDDEYRENVLERNRKYRNEHPEVMIGWREEHKEEITEYNSQYYEKDKETQIGKARNILSSYVQRDKIYKRGECTVTKEWIIENIFTKPCVYCGETDWHKLGCDRKDNSLPHTPENCVPCCGKCNTKKGTMSYDEYMKKVRKES